MERFWTSVSQWSAQQDRDVFSGEMRSGQVHNEETVARATEADVAEPCHPTSSTSGLACPESFAGRNRVSPGLFFSSALSWCLDK